MTVFIVGYDITLVGGDDTCLVCAVCVSIPGYTLGYDIPWGMIYPGV